MRILMLGSKEYPFGVSARHDPKAGGGIEVHVEKLSKYLARLGHEVHIVTRRFPGQASRESRGNIRIHRIRYVPNRFLRTISYNLLGLLYSIWLIRKERIGLIHSHAILAGFFGALMSKLTRTPMVLTPHGINVDWGSPVKEALRLLLKVSVCGSARIIFVSRFARDFLSKRTRKPSALLSNAIDLEDYDFPLPKGPPTFLFLGRLEEVKGVYTLIEAFTLLLKKFPSARLLVAGEGSIKAKVVDQIVDASTKQIRFIGWTDSRKALKQAHCFVLPSRETGQSIAILEAMAAGRIIITSLPYIKPGKTGLKCRTDDPEQLARIMLRVCRSPSRYRKLGTAARKEVSHHTWPEVVKLYEKEYRKTLTKN